MEKELYVNYASTAELSAELAHGKIQKEWESVSNFLPDSYFNQKWYGVESVEEAMTLLDTGDAKKAAEIKAQGEILAEKTCGRAPRIETAVVGCLPCVPNYLRGVPNAMYRVRTEHRDTPVIDIYLSLTFYDGMNTDKVAMAAAKVANVIAATEMAGVRVNLYAVCAGRDGSKEWGFSVRLKDSDTPLNLLNVGFALCNRAFFRVCFLMWMEQRLDKYISGHGRPAKTEQIRRAYAKQPTDVVFNLMEMVENNTPLEELEDTINRAIRATAE